MIYFTAFHVSAPREITCNPRALVVVIPNGAMSKGSPLSIRQSHSNSTVEPTGVDPTVTRCRLR